MNTLCAIVRRLALLTCFCNCAGCTLGTGHCHSVTCGQ